jgi:nitroimidazol reductase NimA-like FMN-containing flavoprotein (pyridoxamine 5'-phosphate oxidase superfamily)
MTEEARTILNDNLIGAIATINEDGSPWVSPVHIVADDEWVYWFSKETTQHSLNIERDPRVSLSLFSADLTKGPKGVYINGPATKLDVDSTTKAKQLLEGKIGFLPSNFVEASGYGLKIGEINRGKSTGNCWYFYT